MVQQGTRRQGRTSGDKGDRAGQVATKQGKGRHSKPGGGIASQGAAWQAKRHGKAGRGMAQRTEGGLEVVKDLVGAADHARGGGADLDVVLANRVPGGKEDGELQSHDRVRKSMTKHDRVRKSMPKHDKA